MATDIRWSPSSYTQTEFMKDRNFPCLVRLVSEKEQNLPQKCLGSLVDVKKNFLVCSQRRRTKGYARHMVWDEETCGFVSDDLIIEIPKDYPGFFEIIPDDPRKTLSRMTSIQEVVTARCTHFLVRTLTGGFRTRETPDGQLEISSKHMIYPGEVLYVIKTLTKHWKLAKNTKKTAKSRYLQCVDSNGLQLYIPLVHPGIYSALYDDGVLCPNFVWTMDDLLTKFDFPLTVRLSFGWPPILPHGHHFSGVVTLFEKRRPDTLVLYSLQEKANVVVELPFDMNVKLQPAENYEEISNDESFQRETKDSATAVYFYLVCMKTVRNNYKNMLRKDLRLIDTISRAGAQLTRGLLAEGQDMKAFNPADFFPPLKDVRTDHWAITFSDTTADMEENGGVYLEDDPEGVERKILVEQKGKTGLSRSKSLAGHSKADALGKVEKVHEPIATPETTRRSRMMELDRREAQC